MSAIEVVEGIKQLSPAEQRKVVGLIHRIESPGKVSEEFQRIADEVFTTNNELFRKLAQ